MKEFFVGLVVLLAFLMLSVIGILLYPVFVVLGFFSQFLIVVILIIVAIWVLGKVALLGMERLKGKKAMDNNNDPRR